MVWVGHIMGHDASVKLELRKHMISWLLIARKSQASEIRLVLPVAGGLRRTPAKQAGASLFARRPG